MRSDRSGRFFSEVFDMTSSIDTGVDVRRVSADTPGLSSRRAAFTEIPVIDLSRVDSEQPGDREALARDVQRACTEVGFFYVSHHGVDGAVIDGALAASRQFFDQDLARKREIDIEHSAFNRGYIPLYGEKNNEHAKGDVKESFDIAVEIEPDDPDYLGGNPLYGPNQRPRGLPGFDEAIDRYFDAMAGLARRLYRAFALALELPEDHFLGMLDKPLDILRLLRYPPQPVVEDEAQIGTGAHSDFDCFTMLYQDPTGGLQALNSGGQWIDATPIDGTFVINVGDMLERWTNGRFVSTVHRVINRSPGERHSIVFFAAPSYDTVIECLPGCSSPQEPPRFAPIKAGDYIVERYEAVLV